MKKRFNLTWRVVTALLLLVALVPALVVGIAAAADTTAPTLRSINWVDNNANGIIDGGPAGPAGDYIYFYFSESMLPGVIDTLAEINIYLDSSATGSADYGSVNANAVWLAGDTVLRVTLGDDCSTQLSGKTVNPADAVKDRAGNSDATLSASLPVIPAAQDTTAPTLLAINWRDVNANGLMDGTDTLRFLFSEEMKSSTIDHAGGAFDACAVLDSTAPGALDYGTNANGMVVAWGGTLGGTDCWVQVTLGTDCYVALTGKTVNPSTIVTDMKGNPDGTTTAPAIPLTPDYTPPALVSIGWVNLDGGSPALISPGDQLVFKFSESMDTTSILLGTLMTDLPISGGPGITYTYGSLTPATLSWDSSETLLTITLGQPTPAVDQLPIGGETVKPSNSIVPITGVFDKAGNPDNTVGSGPAIPTTPTSVTKETTPPVLSSITWNDLNNNGDIDVTDQIVFNFNEAMDWSKIDTLTEINSLLDSTAPGTNDYGTVAAVSAWNLAETCLTVTLGNDCSTQLGGLNNTGAKTVNPGAGVTDRAGNADATAGTGPAIPLAPDTLQPKLLSISWIDNDGDFTIDAADDLLFSFSESMDTTAPITSDADLDSTAVGPIDYGPTAGDVWSADGTQMTVTLGAAPAVDIVDGKLTCTVNPSSLVVDVKGNSDGTVGLGPAIPLPPDKTNPTLIGIVWQDIDNSDTINQGDRLIFSFSEAMDDTSIDGTGGGNDVNVVLDSTALGATDYGTGAAPDYEVIWNVPSYNEVTVILGFGEQIDGGEWVNPTDLVVDRLNLGATGNPDATAGSGIQIPSVSGTSPTIVRSPSTLAFTGDVNGSNPANQTVSISNSGEQALNWAVTKTAAWLTLNPTSGNTSGTVTCSVNTSGLAIGTYNDSITVTGTGATNSPQTVTVSLTIAVPATPTPTPTSNASPTATPAPTAVPTATPVVTATPTPTPTPSTSGTGTVAATGGTVTTGDGKVEVTFPSGAFTTSTTVTIASVSCHPDTDAFVVGSTCFSVTPSGALAQPARICVQLSTYDLNLGDKADLTLGYWANGTWNEASDVTVNADNTICGTTSHLSDWAVLSKTGTGWLWWYWALIGGGAFIVVLAIILLIALPKRGKGEEIPSEELYGEEEEEF